MAEKTVYVGITGDIIHPGIINIIQQGAKYGRLIVGLLTNSAIINHKRLPYLSYEQRKNVIENIKGVSEVIPQEDWSYVPNLKKLKPNYIIHGDDWKDNYLKEIREETIEYMKSIGSEVIEIPYTKGITSSDIFKKIRYNTPSAYQKAPYIIIFQQSNPSNGSPFRSLWINNRAIRARNKRRPG